MTDLPPAPSFSFALPGASIKVSHSSATAIGTPAKDVILVQQHDGELDTVTRIEIWRDGQAVQIVLLLWERHPTRDDVGLLLCDETRTLFLGAGTFAAAVQLEEKRIIDEHRVCLFWSFRRSGGYIIELGELACFLRTPWGHILGEASVDPPYDMFETPEGVRFESIIMGTQWLRFPESLPSGLPETAENASW